MLEEVAKEKELLKRTAKLEVEKEFEKKIDEAVHTARAEWQKTKNLSPVINQNFLPFQVVNLFLIAA